MSRRGMFNGVRLDPLLAIQLGEWPGYWVENVVGHHPSTTNAETEVWDYAALGGTRTTQLGVDTYTIVSTSGVDTVAGTVARYVRLVGLGENWEYVTEVIPLSGITPVVGSVNFRRLLYAYVITVGTAYNTPTKNNTGNISITATLAGTIQGYIPSKQGRTLHSHYTVPANCTAIMLNRSVSGSKTSDAVEIRFHQRPVDPDAAAPYPARQAFAIAHFPAGNPNAEVTGTLSFPEKTDIWVTAQDSTTSQTSVSVEYSLLIVPGALRQDPGGLSIDDSAYI